MLSTVIAVVGTLLGAVVAGLIQNRTARTAREIARRDKELEAVTAFASAVAAHRRAMAVREDLRLTGADADSIAAARTESHTTRAAIEAPKVLVSILMPRLAPAADRAAQASYALRGAHSAARLNALRETAIEAANDFTSFAAARFA